MPLELKELMLHDPRLTLGVAESITCGWLQARIGSVSGASTFFLGGLTAYDVEQKIKHLGVEREHAVSVNAVSAQVAEQMALGACWFFGSDLGLATTGYAEPSAAMGVAEPFAFWALAQVRQVPTPVVFSGRVSLSGASRVEAQRRMTDAVLSELIRYLVGFRERD
ncbi:MAG: nicotinamide-nucleotide amidohydrolase family protein [Nibricoccus sp.]